jgi:hypothetical protein
MAYAPRFIRVNLPDHVVDARLPPAIPVDVPGGDQNDAADAAPLPG